MLPYSAVSVFTAVICVTVGLFFAHGHPRTDNTLVYDEEAVQRDAAQGGGTQTHVSCAHALLRPSLLLPTEPPIC